MKLQSMEYFYLVSCTESKSCDHHSPKQVLEVYSSLLEFLNQVLKM